MFTTFSAHMSPVNNGRSRSNSTRAPGGKQKRRHVTHACDNCRTSRIKCDDYQPCRNCLNRGETCRTSHPWEAHSLSAAKLEIERLQRRVTELEQDGPQSPSSPPTTSTTQTSSPLSASSNSSNRPLSVQDGTSSSSQLTNVSSNGSSPDGGQRGRRPPLSHSTTSFISKLSNHLEQSLKQPYPMISLEPIGITQERSGSGSAHMRSQEGRENEVREFSKTQEGHFLALIWHHIHCIYPILDEEAFRQYYNSLWANSGSGIRRPSALVDIMLALCMQLSSTFLLDDGVSGKTWDTTPSNDSGLVGQPLYNRAHRLLLEDQQGPTLQTVQTLIFSILYLMNAGRLNSAHTMLGVAIRIARAIGLHLNPVETLCPNSRALRGRVWWSLSTLDGYLTVTMGLEPHIPHADVLSCSLPAEVGEGTVVSSPRMLPDNEDLTWFSFHLQWAKLVLAFRSIHTVFHDKQLELLRDHSGTDLHNEPPLLESVAGYMSRQMKPIQEWVDGVPALLKLDRKNGSPGFSFIIDGAAVQIDPYTPLWLQRQRFILEIKYHHLCLAMMRPFLRFKNGDSVPTLHADSHSVVGLQHALTLTSIVHQALSESETLIGYLYVFRCQWDATLYLLGFMLANPVCSFTQDARRSVNTAIHTFRLLERYLSVSTSALGIVHEILGHAATLINQCRMVLSPWGSSSLPSVEPCAAHSTLPQLSSKHIQRELFSNDYYLGLPGSLDPTFISASPDHFLSSLLHSSLEPSRDSSSGPPDAPGTKSNNTESSSLILEPSIPMDLSYDELDLRDPDTDWVLEYGVLLDGWQSGVTDGQGGVAPT